MSELPWMNNLIIFAPDNVHRIMMRDGVFDGYFWNIAGHQKPKKLAAFFMSYQARAHSANVLLNYTGGCRAGALSLSPTHRQEYPVYCHDNAGRVSQMEANHNSKHHAHAVRMLPNNSAELTGNQYFHYRLRLGLRK